MKKIKTLLMVLAIGVSFGAHLTAKAQGANEFEFSGKGKLETVPYVDLNRYLGKWYEVARITKWFERKCYDATAEYALMQNGMIQVTNTCIKRHPGGRVKVANGRARIVDTESNSKLEVSFFGPFWGDYWIVELGANYEYTVVGSPDRKTLWILSRTPEMDPKLVDEILERRRLQGWNLSKVDRDIRF